MGAKVTPLEFLEAVYENEQLPLSVRMRAAIEAAPYMHAKLTAQANFHFDASFAVRLDKAIAIVRSQQPMKLIEAQPVPTQQELKGPMSRLRRV
jgi:hypothetical protein